LRGSTVGSSPRRPDATVSTIEVVHIESTTESRPFSVEVPEEDLVDLRRRIAATRWPERETVADESQGVQLATMQELVRYGAPSTTSGGSMRG